LELIKLLACCPALVKGNALTPVDVNELDEPKKKGGVSARGLSVSVWKLSSPPKHGLPSLSTLLSLLTELKLLNPDVVFMLLSLLYFVFIVV
jgi:hypothetical protein